MSARSRAGGAPRGGSAGANTSDLEHRRLPERVLADQQVFQRGHLAEQADVLVGAGDAEPRDRGAAGVRVIVLPGEDDRARWSGDPAR